MLRTTAGTELNLSKKEKSIRNAELDLKYCNFYRKQKAFGISNVFQGMIHVMRGTERCRCADAFIWRWRREERGSWKWLSIERLGEDPAQREKEIPTNADKHRSYRDAFLVKRSNNRGYHAIDTLSDDCWLKSGSSAHYMPFPSHVAASKMLLTR